MVLCGAEGGIWTHMVSRTILSRVRLPFRHFGLIILIVKTIPNDFYIIPQKNYFGNNYSLYFLQ